MASVAKNWRKKKLGYLHDRSLNAIPCTKFWFLFLRYLTVSPLLWLSLSCSSIILLWPFSCTTGSWKEVMGLFRPIINCVWWMMCASWGYCLAAWEGSILNSWTAEFWYDIMRWTEWVLCQYTRKSGRKIDRFFKQTIPSLENACAAPSLNKIGFILKSKETGLLAVSN